MVPTPITQELRSAVVESVSLALGQQDRGVVHGVGGRGGLGSEVAARGWGHCNLICLSLLAYGQALVQGWILAPEVRICVISR